MSNALKVFKKNSSSKTKGKKDVNFYDYDGSLVDSYSAEEFLQLWDMDSKLRFDHNKPDSITLLQSNPKLEKDTIYIFDSLSEGIISTTENVFYV